MRPFVVVIEIPALTDYLKYLREQNAQNISALAAKVNDLTAKLQHADTALQNAVTEVPKP